jgi:3-hydroxy acid dehydrogenase/malonic semialdehyde reductase
MADYTHHTPKTVLITGATGDFGKAFAACFAALGCNLVLHGRSQEKLNGLCQQYKDSTGLCFDITDHNAMKTAMKDCPSVDLLINNAGLALGLDRGHEANIDDWETMIDVNVKALVRMTRIVAEDMAGRKAGHIINIGSKAGNYPYRGGSVYCASKAFVKQFSLSLRADFAGLGIRVTNIEPAQVETQFSTVRFKGDETRAGAVYGGTVSLKAEDIAESVVWAATLPPHVNINRLEIMPTMQYPAGLAIERNQ